MVELEEILDSDTVYEDMFLEKIKLLLNLMMLILSLAKDITECSFR